MLKILRFSLTKGMITSAIVLSKVSMTKRFKPRCLCYWRVDIWKID